MRPVSAVTILGLLVVACILGIASSCSPNCPVLLIGGLVGSTLRAKVTNRNPQVSGCRSNSNWYTLWVGSFSIADKKCFNTNAALRYGNGANGSRELMNASGVQVQPLGGLDGMKKIWAVGYMNRMIKELEKTGYVPGKSLFGYTYDWRSTGEPVSTSLQLEKLQRRVEHVSEVNGGQPVHLVTHSLGVALVQMLLNSEAPVQWKHKYVASLTYLAPILKGASGALQGIIMGPSISSWLPQFIQDWVVPMTRTLPSMLWMSPQPHDADFWNRELKGRPFIENEETGKHYGLNDYSEFLQDLGAPVLREALESVSSPRNVAPVSVDPMIPTFCAFANDSQTTLRMKFKTAKFTGQTVLEEVPGDGTVTAEAMRWCYRWSNSTVKEYKLHAGAGAHVKTATSPAVVKDVVKWLQMFNH